MTKALVASSQDLSAWNAQQKRCLGAMLYFMCAHDDVRPYARMGAVGKMTTNRLRVLSDALREKECTPPLPASLTPTRHLIERAYLALDGL